jgi:fatty-acyl-CoA synthase
LIISEHAMKGVRVTAEGGVDAMAHVYGPAVVVDPDRPLTMSAFFLAVCGRFAAAEALVFDDPLRAGETVRWTYADLEAQARAVARGLLAQGVSAGARVAILMANRPEAVAAVFGASLVGAVAVPVSTFSPKPELEQLVALSRARVVLAQSRMGDRDFAGDLREFIAADDSLLRCCAILGEDVVSDGQVLAWADFLGSGDAVPAGLVDVAAAAVETSDDGVVIFSSGTTAVPKGVLHNHRAPTLQFWVQADLFARTPSTRLWSALPLFWTAGMNTVMGATLAGGGCWVMQEGFDAGEALRLLERERVTEPYTLPHQARALAEHPDWLATDLSALTCVFGKSVFAHHPSVTGDPNWQMPVGWGMSEACAFISGHHSTAGRESMKRSLGPLLPGLELQVIDPETGATVLRDHDGELLIRGATLMVRYLGKDRDQCFDADGWLHTGDVGFVDADSEIHWTGRRTEMIKTGGANVSPAELEVALRACPQVRLARVIGVPDERLDQIVVLCVEPADGAEVDEEFLRTFLRERVASYKVPKRVVIFAAGEIPMTASGTKVRDDELLQLLDKRLTTPKAGVTR